MTLDDLLDEGKELPRVGHEPPALKALHAREDFNTGQSRLQQLPVCYNFGIGLQEI